MKKLSAEHQALGPLVFLSITVESATVAYIRSISPLNLCTVMTVPIVLKWLKYFTATFKDFLHPWIPYLTLNIAIEN
jgi:hypothetical protein